jgi:hypothetical protein
MLPSAISYRSDLQTFETPLSEETTSSVSRAEKKPEPAAECESKSEVEFKASVSDVAHDESKHMDKSRIGLRLIKVQLDHRGSLRKTKSLASSGSGC